MIMKKIISLAILGLLAANFLFAQTTSRSFTTPGYDVFTPPPGVDSVLVEIFGAGGGGNPFNGNGGGSGAFTKVAFKLKGNGLVYTYVGRGGTSAKSGESSLLYWDSAGVKVLYGIAYGGSGINGRGGGIAPQYPGANGYYFGQRGGNASKLVGSYYGAGGGTPYNTPGDAPVATGSSCNIGGTSEVGGPGGNGAGPGCTMTNGSFPGGGGGSGSGTAASGANGSINFYWICPSPVLIGGTHTVPYPQERNIDFPDLLKDSVGQGTSPLGNGIQYWWEMSKDNGASWNPAPGTTVNDVSYALDTLQTAAWFRRNSNICDLNQASNIIKISVFNDLTYPDDGTPGKNGIIKGFVKTKYGNPVKGDSVMAIKIIDLPGSQKQFTYYAETDNTGAFTIDSIFYGDRNNGDPSSVQFKIIPFKYQHGFDPITGNGITRSLSSPPGNVVELFNSSEVFIDTTAISILGKTFQQCYSCITAAQSQTREIDSVNIFKGTSIKAETATQKTVDGYGRYAVSVDEYGKTFKITPQFDLTKFPNLKYHKFKPADTTILALDQDIFEVNFRDTTTFNVEGTFTAGCNEQIGKAVLHFVNIPTDKSRLPSFIFDVPTNQYGQYNVRLPAATYKVTVLSYTPKSATLDPKEDEIKMFFSGERTAKSIDPDSLIVSLDTANAVFNLRYQRPAELQIVGWTEKCKTNFGVPFDIWKTLEERPLEFRVFQGSPIKTGSKGGCPLFYNDPKFDSVKIFSTIQTDLVVQKFVKPVSPLGVAFDTLNVNFPNTTADYTKGIDISYTDKYGTTVNVSRRVVVVGSRPRPGQTFQTVSPQIPTVVLHDPPGDQSFATWEKTQTVENALRFYTQKANDESNWVQGKIGAAGSVGGEVTVFGVGVSWGIDFAAWYQRDDSWGTSAKNSSENELIIKHEIKESYSTSATDGGIGADGDIYVTNAWNIIYGITDDILMNGCMVVAKESEIFAPDSVLTTAYYTKKDLLNSIDDFNILAAKATTPEKAYYYTNQASIWAQMIKNNDINVARAKFVGNKTFTGGGQSFTFTTTDGSTNSSSVEFGLEVNSSFANSGGFEIAGNGVNGGKMISFRTETGSSTNKTSTSETTISYTLSDKDAGDKFTVDISTDPVYNTPVFTTKAGLSSCPPEPNTILRDDMTLSIVGSPEINVPSPFRQGSFSVTCGNRSTDKDPKYYRLYLINNTDAASVTANSINGSNISASDYFLFGPIAKGKSQTIKIFVQKDTTFGAADTYKDLTFILTDACTGTSTLADATSDVPPLLVSVNFASLCSGINLSTPEPGGTWVTKASDNNIRNITFDGYDKTPAKLQKVVVQYRETGNDVWIDALNTIKTPADLGNTSTNIPWDVTGLSDGKYDIRMKLVCSAGLVYSRTASGIIDRKPPSLFGRPDPTDGNYAPGDLISVSFDENINITNLNVNKALLYNMSNNALIPSTVSGNGNKIVIVPSVPLVIGDSVRLVVSNISDLYGNVMTAPIIYSFTVGTLPPVISPAKPVKVYASPASTYENVNGQLIVRFKMDVAPVRNIVKVNFNIGGTAILNTDYTVSMDTITTTVRNSSTGINELIPLISTFNGSQGSIYINSSSAEAVLRITPVKDSICESDETITINVTAGGDYNLADSLTTTATILNDDLQPPVIDSTGALTFCTGESVTLTAETPNVKPRWATSVIRVSNQYSANEWGSKRALNEPDVYPTYGDIQYAWSPTNPDNPREFLELRFANPGPINFINIYETFNPGAIDTVYVKDPTGAWVRVYAENALPAAEEARILNIPIPQTTFNVTDIRIALNSAAVPGFNEIDAVGIGLDTTYTSYLWSNGQTTKSIVVNQSGTYKVTVKNAVGQAATSDSLNVVVIPPVKAISGLTKVCIGKTIQLSNTVSGGVWTSDKTNIATVSNTGVVTGVAAGTVTIFYATPPNNFGCANVASISITVNALPTLPAITGTTRVCIGNLTTLSNTKTGGNWMSSDTNIATITTGGVVRGKAAGTTTISYTTAANANGCVNVVTTVFTVNALPVVASITGSNNVCVGLTTALANTTTGGTWSSSDTTKAKISSTGLLTAKAAGAVTITYTTTANSNGCTNATTKIITVNPIPVPSAIGGKTSVCIGEPSQLTNTLAGGIWSSNKTNVATVSATGILTGVITGTATISYTITGTGGCVQSVTAAVTVSSVPSVSAIVGNNNVCVGGQTTLGNPTIGGTWSSSDTTKATVSSSGVVTGRVAGVVTISYTTKANSNGCRNKATLQFTVNGLPELGNITGVKTICSNGSSQLGNSTTGGTWSSNSTSIATINNTGFVTGKAVGTATVTYSLTSAAGCYNSISTPVIVRGIPNVASITGNNSVCVAGVTTLSTTTTGGSWSSSNINIATVSSTGIVIGVAAGNATITYTTSPNASGCTNTTSRLITINALPTVNNITGTRTVCAGKTTKLNNTTTGGSWSSSDNTKATVSSTGLVTGVAVGSVTITYTTVADANGCTNKVSVTVTVTGPCAFNPVLAKGSEQTTEIVAESMVATIAPNPTGNIFYVMVKSTSKENINIRVLDVNGKTAFASRGKSGQTFTFGEQLTAGTYLVEVRQGEEVKTLKAVKVKI